MGFKSLALGIFIRDIEMSEPASACGKLSLAGGRDAQVEASLEHRLCMGT